MNAEDVIPSWQAWDQHHGERQTATLVRVESALGLPYGLHHHQVHDVLVAWRRAGLSYRQSFDAFRAGARTLMP